MAEKSKKNEAVLISTITGQEQPGTVKIGEVNVEFTYKPYNVTVQDILDAFSDDEAKVKDIAEQLSLVLSSWNLVLKEGETFPPTVENIRMIPMQVLSAIQSYVAEQAEMGEADGSFGGA